MGIIGEFWGILYGYFELHFKSTLGETLGIFQGRFCRELQGADYLQKQKTTIRGTVFSLSLLPPQKTKN